MTKPTQAAQPTPPPQPPIILTPQVAINPDTPTKILWHIAKHIPELRRWVIANPAADAKLLEYIAQQGGPDVRYSFDILFAAYDYCQR